MPWPAYDDLVSSTLADWALGLSGDLVLACSPHRIAAFTAYVTDDYLEDDRDQALALLEPWARYCLERTAVTGEPAERTLAMARRAAQDPEDVAGDHGNNLNRPLDETLHGPAGT